MGRAAASIELSAEATAMQDALCRIDRLERGRDAND